MRATESASARALRQEIGGRNLQRAAAGVPHEVTFGRVPSVIYAEDDGNAHGNFLPASYRRILANASWAARLAKTYTGSAQLPRARDRHRGELECAVSSDALLMNVFCYPGVLRRSGVCGHLGIAPGLQPTFGARAQLAMWRGEIDRTEFDMQLGDVWVEAKLTEGGFGRATRERLLRYDGVEQWFDVDELPCGAAHIVGYQLVRGLLAALQHERRYLVLLDQRRADLQEICFRVLRAVRDAEARTRFRLLSWQELAGALPPQLQTFLDEKYGISAP